MIAEKSIWNQWQDRISNDSIRNELGVDSIEEAARKSRLRWWGHIQRMRDNRLPKQILGAGDVGKRSRGRPRRRWLDSVRNDLECILSIET